MGVARQDREGEVGEPQLTAPFHDRPVDCIARSSSSQQTGRTGGEEEGGGGATNSATGGDENTQPTTTFSKNRDFPVGAPQICSYA